MLQQVKNNFKELLPTSDGMVVMHSLKDEGCFEYKVDKKYVPEAKAKGAKLGTC